ncbi:class I SAM-dependent methyltransferase [Nocardioides caeni]|uniref:Class I SAM-dependent methyltransferase n=1 Tax=Nocardioides caeni TaxID=574700 RepID=A0A4V4HK36_9ACTN|nr:class I SAM-dependent methyltransferase [Nocardioides caeni]THV12926.1 class I SAM-dependent methyltransferase [Nocardioides caeni]
MSSLRGRWAPLVALAITAALLAVVIAGSDDRALAVGLALVALGVAANLCLLVHLIGRINRIDRQVDRAHTRLGRQRRMLDRADRRLAQTRKAVAGVRQAQRVDRDARVLGNRAMLGQIQETVRLFTSIPTTAQVPTMGGWAASADLVGALLDEFIERRPALVVECGSGVSTLWLALAARQHGIPTRIVALDHDREFAAKTRVTLARHGVADHAEVRDAPLGPVTVGDREWTWYDATALAGLEDIGLLFVDGPPTAVGEHARFPALPLLEDRLARRCSIVLDDMIRTDEQEVAQLWHDRHPDLERTDLRLEKGATVFRRG